MKEIILIIDDEEEDVINFSEHVNELQTDSIVESEQDFSKSIEAINAIKKRGDKVVAAFIDICEKRGSNFPERGLDTITAVNQKFPDIFAVAYTQYGEVYITRAYEKGAHWHVRKQELTDLSSSTLKAKIEDHIKRGGSDRSQFKDWNVEILARILEGISGSVERICDVRKRHFNRENVYSIKDEYDLQDLFWSLLKPIFPRMVDEVPIPKHMGKSSRADFYIPEIKTILELKYVKVESQAGEIPKQLDNDISWYSAYLEAERLFSMCLRKTV